MIDLLEQRDRREMTTAAVRQNVENYDERDELYAGTAKSSFRANSRQRI